MNNKIICYYCNKNIDNCCNLQNNCCHNFYNIIKYRLKYNTNIKNVYCNSCFINNHKNNFYNYNLEIDTESESDTEYYSENDTLQDIINTSDYHSYEDLLYYYDYSKKNSLIYSYNKYLTNYYNKIESIINLSYNIDKLILNNIISFIDKRLICIKCNNIFDNNIYSVTQCSICDNFYCTNCINKKICFKCS
jgi:hypothetical protein